MEKSIDRNAAAFGGASNDELWKVGRYQFCRTVPEGTPDAVSYSYTDSKTEERVTKWRIEKNALQGRIFNAEFEDTDFGRVFVLSMFDDAGVFKLMFKVGNPKKFLEENFMWFAKKIGGVDPAETFITGFYVAENRKSDRTRQDGKGNTIFPAMFLVDADGARIGTQFKKGERELPAWEQREEDDGFGKMKTVWNAFEHNKALIAEVSAWCEKVKEAEIKVPTFAPQEPEPAPVTQEGEEEEVPF